MPEPERIDRCRAALIAYDVCRRALTPSDPARRAAMHPVLDAWVRMIALARALGVPVIYTTPVSRADGADVVMLHGFGARPRRATGRPALMPSTPIPVGRHQRGHSYFGEPGDILMLG
ncbi:MAG TPA: hypothetical protein VKI44_08760 [Acetobacteraceae bacterium]|nr:hypothetical protein [Acetobacteraceae bacterium]